MSLIVAPRLYVQDETQYWNLRRLHHKYRRHLVRIESVYLYDAQQTANLCEFARSYHLTPVETRPVCQDGTPEPVRDFLEEWVQEHSQADAMYVHCDELDSRPSVVTLPDWPINLDACREDVFAEVYEYCLCNQQA